MNAYFGLDLEGQTYTAPLVDLDDVHGCRPNYRPDLNGSIALIARGPRGDSGCTFAIKAMNAQLSNAGGVVVFNNEGDDLLPMPENYAYPIIIPAIFIGESDGLALWKQLQAKERVVVSINGTGQVQPQELNNDLTRILFISICAIWCLIFVCYIISYIQKCCKVNERQRDFQNLETKSYRPLEDPVDSDGNAADESGSALEEGGGNSKHGKSAFGMESCVICLDDFEKGDKLVVLPCGHEFHKDCIGPWLLKKSNLCPVCKQSFRPEKKSASTSDSLETDANPLLTPLNSANVDGDENDSDEIEAEDQELLDNNENDSNERGDEEGNRCSRNCQSYLGVVVAISMILTGVLVLVVLMTWTGL